MAKPKQKWTTEEEEALCAGVEKHGHGKWKVILSDPEFATSLANRSNIDLKDKWRNLNVSGNVYVTSGKEKVRIPRLEGGTNNPPVSSPEPLAVVPLLEYGGTAEASNISLERKTSAEYEAMIFEALLSVEDPNGSDVTTILNFIEERYEVPLSFRRSLSSKLRRLVLKGEIEKVDNCYKIKNATFGTEKPLQEEPMTYNNDNHNEEEKSPERPPSPILTETLEDASLYAAYTITVAENLAYDAVKACKESDKFAKILEKSEAMKKLVEDLHEKCTRDGIVKMAI